MIPFLRNWWLLTILSVVLFGLAALFLNAAAANWWASWGPPSDDPEQFLIRSGLWTWRAVAYVAVGSSA